MYIFDENQEFTYPSNRLEQAVANGDILAVRNLIDSFSITNDPWRDYDLLKFAVAREVGEIMKVLVDEGFRVNRVPENDDDNTPLHLAVASGHIELVQILQQAGASQTARNWANETPLHLASRLGHSAITEVLLMNLTPEEISSNLADNFGITYLHIACWPGLSPGESKDIVMRFVDAGIDLELQVSANEPKYGGYRPLHFAVENERVREVQQLLSANVKVNVNTNDGMTPLHFAAKNGNATILDMLLKCNQAHTIDLNSQVNNDASKWPGYTALHFALRANEFNIDLQNKTDIVQKLLVHGVSADLTDSRGWSPLHLAAHAGQETMVNILLAHGANVNRQESTNKSTPLHLAVTAQHDKMTNLLIAKGANIGLEQDNGMTPVHVTAQWLHKRYIDNLLFKPLFDMGNKLVSRKNIVRILMKYLEKIPGNPKDSEGVTLLHVAIAAGNQKAIQLLISRGVNINEKVNDDSPFWQGYTPLLLAVEYDFVETVQLLVKVGATVIVENTKEETPFDLAKRSKRNPARFRSILMNGLVNEIETRPNVNGMTKFHLACMTGYSELVLSELDSGTDVDAQVASVVGPWGGYTPLHFAILFDKYEIVDLLLKYNAEVEARNAKGLTPLHLALLLKNVMIATKLLEEQADPNSVISGHPIHNGKTPLHLVSSKPEFGDTLIQVLLDYGADINIEDKDGQIPFYNASVLMMERPSIRYIISGWHEHAIKLEIIGFPITEKVKTNMKIIDESLREFDRYRNYHLIQLCIDEVKKLKNWNIDDHNTLYSILCMSLHRMVNFVYKPNFQSILLLSDFKEQFPCYGCLIRQQFIKGIVRNSLLPSAFSLMENIAGIGMPDFCLESIFNYLSNEDIAAFIAANQN